jgi:hypothetical protein
VPDFRGYFLRGLEASATPTVETQANRTLGSTQLDEVKSHFHNYVRNNELVTIREGT